MACLGGTTAEPRVWIRYKAGERTEQGFGRTCRRRAPWTTTAGETVPGAWNCSSCVLYRGNSRWNGKLTGMKDDEPYALSLDEADEYDAAIEATFDDDWRPIQRFLRKMSGETYGRRSAALRAIDERVAAQHAEYMRGYREAHSEYAKDHDRKRADRARRFRAEHPEEVRLKDRLRKARQRAATRDVPTLAPPPSRGSPPLVSSTAEGWDNRGSF